MTICGLYYKPMTIINDDSRVINKLETSLTDDARVVIYDCHVFIVHATDADRTHKIGCIFSVTHEVKLNREQKSNVESGIMKLSSRRRGDYIMGPVLNRFRSERLLISLIVFYKVKRSILNLFRTGQKM
jgi:hypothetical protein